MLTRSKTMIIALFALGSIGLVALDADAHCDAENGPVAVAARQSLQTGEFEKVAIWMGEKQSPELRRRFEQCRDVYATGDKAKKVAERYFVETAIRLHREAEGMPFTGVKPARPLPPDIAAAEKALEAGRLAPVTDMLSSALEKQTRKWFRGAMKAKTDKEKSVEAGRRYVDAYVKYVIYVHGLYKTIQAGPQHGVGE